MSLTRRAGDPDPAHADLAAALDDRVDGDVRFDEYAQVLYATDGSIYGARPAGVVFPTGVEDVRAAVAVARDHDVPVLPRGAGSSLAGQAVGPGCVVLDCSRHMDAVVDVDPGAREATVQPGVVLDDLDDHLADHGLKFAPDPASSNRATVGGAVGNNSTGAHSVRYGITDAYVESIRAVLADGSVLHAREVVVGSPAWDAIVAGEDREAHVYETVRALVADHEAEIEARYPELKRRVSGYNLDRVVRETDDGETAIDLARLFVGSEGTLGVVVEATLSLVTVPEATAVALYCYDDLLDAVAAVPTALETDPSAVELMDAEVFRLARESDGYAAYAEPIPEEAAAALMVEFDDERHDDLRAAVDRADALLATGSEGHDGPFEVLHAFDAGAQADLWSLRKAAIPLLMSLEGDAKPYPFIEDATVPPAELADYVAEFEAVLERHGTSAAYFAHAGSGTLHVRPVLSLKDDDGVETMHAIAEDVTDLVLEHHGSFSGEHGDGMARTEFNPKMYGPGLWRAFKELKTAFDPGWLLHPGNVVYRDGPDDVGPDSDRGVGADMREHLRYGPAYESIEPQTTLDFGDEGGFAHLVELCNGCGTCRQTGTDVMCPTWRASDEEIQSTRGRANMLRAAISGDLPESELYGERFQSEVLDLCVGCKGCKSDCPTGVDLAKLKAEVKHQYHDETGTSRRERLFADVHRYARLGSALAPVSNWATRLPGADRLAEALVGLAPDRELPRFAPRDLRTRLADLDTPTDTERRAALVADPYTAYAHPEVGQAAARVLAAAGVAVELADVPTTGRAAYSQGMLDLAREHAGDAVSTLVPRIEAGYDVVCVEPSDAAMLRDELTDLGLGTDAAHVADHATGVCEYLDDHRLGGAIDWDAPDQALAFHGHCHQKAANRDHHAVGLLRRAGYEVDPLDTSCCGMAGSFGYETEHYELSQAMGDLVRDAVAGSSGEVVVASGGSCRTQLGDGPDGQPAHPVEKLAEALG